MPLETGPDHDKLGPWAANKFWALAVEHDCTTC